MSFDSRTYYFIPRPPETHNFSTNIAISRKEGLFFGEPEKWDVRMSYSGQPVSCGLSTNIRGEVELNRVLVLSWPREEDLQGCPLGSSGHTLHNSHYNEMDI